MPQDQQASLKVEFNVFDPGTPDHLLVSSDYYQFLDSLHAWQIVPPLLPECTLAMVTGQGVCVCGLHDLLLLPCCSQSVQ